MNYGYDFLSKESLENIAKAVNKKDNTKLFDTVETEKEAQLVAKELKMQGYGVKITTVNGIYKIYAIMPEMLSYAEAMQSNQFEKLAWGRYSFTRNIEAKFFDYDFDDGSIWRVIKGEDGKDYLIKETSEDSEEILRGVTANNTNSFINENNVKTATKILYDNINEDLLNDLLESNTKNNFLQMIDAKFKNTLEKEANNESITNPDYLANLNGIMKIAINKNIDKVTFLEIINKYKFEFLNKN